MIEFSIYPQGKRRIVTFSYDDGPKEDVQLIELFNRYGVKGTFHLNGKHYLNLSREEKLALRERYRGHEISCHTLQHGWPERMPSISVVNETIRDRAILEEIAGYPVVGMSYPFGSFHQKVVQVMENCGIVYSRTTRSTGNTVIPENFLLWHPTCHHNKALELAKKFMSQLEASWVGPLFYVWGHSYEFQTEEEWGYMEQVLQEVAGSDKIWYATNIEIHDYIAAQRQLRISADETILQNPTAIDVWVEKDSREIIHIPAGQTVQL